MCNNVDRNRNVTSNYLKNEKWNLQIRKKYSLKGNENSLKSNTNSLKCNNANSLKNNNASSIKQ